VGNISKQIEKINYCLYQRPDLIPILYKDTSIKKGLLHSRLRRAVSHRIGIEFEGYGHFMDPFINDHYPECIENRSKFISKLYGLLDFDEDKSDITINGVQDIPNITELPNNLNDADLDLLVVDAEDTPEEHEPTIQEEARNSISAESLPLQPEDNSIESIHLTEIRVSIKDYTQLKGLYNILNDMKDYCKIPLGGGIHIHVDFHDYFDDKNRKLAIKWMKNHLSRVESIFPKYLGTYNRREVGDTRKGTYVNFSYHKSIEFRIAPLTYNYETLIKWIIGCEKVVSDLINECHLVKKKSKTIKSTNGSDLIRNEVILEGLTFPIGDSYIRVDPSNNGNSYTAWTEMNIRYANAATTSIYSSDMIVGVSGSSS